MFFVQMWLALPDEYEEMAPAFEHFSSAELPVIRQGGATVHLAMGAMWGEKAPTTCHASTLFAEIRMDAGAQLVIPPEYGELGLMLLEGEGRLDDEALGMHELSILSDSQCTLRSDKGARLVLLGGDTFPSPRYIGGQFVASSPQKLRRWMEDAATGKWPRIGG